MNDMTFPVLDVDEIAHEVVDAAPRPGALVTLREHTLQPLSAVEQGIAALRAEHGSTNYDITTPAGYNLARLRRAAVREVRYCVPKIVKAKKDELAGLRDQVEEEGERIIEILRQIEDPHDDLIIEEDQRRASIKAEAARVAAEQAAALAKAEAKRVEQHEAFIATIRRYLPFCQAPDMTAERIERGIQALTKVGIGAEREEYAGRALEAQAETLEGMRVLHAAAVGREAEAARLELQRVEQARVAEEQRVERARIEQELTEIRRQAAELAAQRAEADRLERLIEQRRETRLEEATQAVKDMAKAIAGAAHVDTYLPPTTATQPFEHVTGAAIAATLAADEDANEAAALVVPATPITLAAINKRLGFTVTVGFLAKLGIVPNEARPGAKQVEYSESFAEIVAALVRHLATLGQ